MISGTDAAGNALTPVDFTYGAANDGTTLGDLINKINTAYAGQATAALSASGNLTLTADKTGTASLSLTISAGTSTGVTDWTANALTVATDGAAGGDLPGDLGHLRQPGQFAHPDDDVHANRPVRLEHDRHAGRQRRRR